MRATMAVYNKKNCFATAVKFANLTLARTLGFSENRKRSTTNINIFYWTAVNIIANSQDKTKTAHGINPIRRRPRVEAKGKKGGTDLDNHDYGTT